jgi:proline-specific peptidase
MTDDGVVLQTRTVGPADATETLISIHGGPGLSLEAMSTFESLAGPGRRVVSYDQRGAGRSTSPDDLDYSLEVQVADLEAIQRALGAESVQLIGQSWGGAIAAAYAATHPQRVSALVLVGAVPLDRAEYLAGQRRFQDRVAVLQRVGDIDDVIPSINQGSCLDAFTAVLPAYLADPKMRSPTTLTSCTADTSRATYEAFVADDAVEELAKHLGAFESPVLLIAGEHDVFGPDWPARNRQLLANASIETVVIADAGHLVTAEQPKETISAIRAFLEN